MSDTDLVKDVIYKEYERLHTTIDAIVNGSFTDFATLSVFGAMLAWKPIADRLTSSDKKDATTPFVLWLGFSAMIVVLAIIATRDLLKQSIVFFTIGELKPYEKALRASLPSLGQTLFRTSDHFGPWFRGYFMPISAHFRALVVMLGLFFPLIVLWPRSRKFALAYLALGIACIAVYLSALHHFVGLARAVFSS